MSQHLAVCAGVVAKFQTTGMEIVEGGVNEDKNQFGDYVPTNSVSHAQSLKKGVQVQIMKTDNVEQRAPHLIGQVGVIKDVPQHPNTWFKVKFSTGAVFTFRPSALRSWSPGMPELKSETKESQEELDVMELTDKERNGMTSEEVCEWVLCEFGLLKVVFIPLAIC